MLQIIKNIFKAYCELVILSNKMEAHAWDLTAKKSGAPINIIN